LRRSAVLRHRKKHWREQALRRLFRRPVPTGKAVDRHLRCLRRKTFSGLSGIRWAAELGNGRPIGAPSSSGGAGVASAREAAVRDGRRFGRARRAGAVFCPAPVLATVALLHAGGQPTRSRGWRRGRRLLALAVPLVRTAPSDANLPASAAAGNGLTGRIHQRSPVRARADVLVVAGGRCLMGWSCTTVAREARRRHRIADTRSG